jgi:cytochrome P450 PksS
MSLLTETVEAGQSPKSAVQIASPGFKANPFPFYARLRAEAPACCVTLPTRETAWLITRYDDVAMVLKDERFVKDTKNALSRDQEANLHWFRKLFTALRTNMLSKDPPDHTRLRGLVKAFSPRLVEQLQGRIEVLTNDLLDKVQRRGHMDLIRDFALPLPATVIAELLGVPVKDRHAFHRGTNAVISAAASTWAMMIAIPRVWSLIRYIRKLVKKRRGDPRDDLVSVLAQAEEAGDTLSEDELMSMVFLLLAAGHETTVNLIGNGTLALLQHPDQMDRLRSDPALIKLAVEEFLRYTSPVEIATERYASADVAISGVTIPRGAMVYAVIGSANRDERQFVDPDTLDITREPNKHLAFGLGPHFCIGAPLARLEGQIAINTLLKRMPDLRLAVAPEDLRWRRGLLLRGLESLPVAFGSHGGGKRS